jgi:hypothetical protein
MCDVNDLWEKNYLYQNGDGITLFDGTNHFVLYLFTEVPSIAPGDIFLVILKSFLNAGCGSSNSGVCKLRIEP